MDLVRQYTRPVSVLVMIESQRTNNRQLSVMEQPRLLGHPHMLERETSWHN